MSIDKFGNLFLNSNNIKFEQLEFKVLNMIDKSRNLVVLQADKNITHGSVINVLDVLRSIDGLKIAISTKSID